MPAIDKSDIKLGFYVAAGFFLFGLVLAIAQYILMRMRQQRG